MNGDVDIIRLEDNDNEVFVQVTFEDDEYGILNYAKWLTAREISTYRATQTDETIATMMGKYYLMTKKNKQAEEAAQQA